MKGKIINFIIGILSFLLLFSIIASDLSAKIDESNLQNIVDLNKVSKLNSTNEDAELGSNDTFNDTGCCSVLVHAGPGHDVLSYRRDSVNFANILIDKINFNGQTAIKEYKTQGGYFTHTIITQNGWIIGIGGKDDPDTTKHLEQLASDIISKGHIEKGDMNMANSIIERNGWGHFLIKSPDDKVGITARDYRVHKSITKLFKMKNGDYIKVPNNPRYYDKGKFNRFSSDPDKAAIKIIGNDIYGQSRRDVITYDYNSAKVNIWASFDGGAFLGGYKGNPDDIQYIKTKINGNDLPVIPGKRFLGEEDLNISPHVNSVFSNQKIASSLNNVNVKDSLAQLNI
ncbi:MULTISPECIES: hypothetical protein [Methanobacterium]|uniref:Uncharacterized protein n=1 Tax=Methanobacterium bryantii TaxID=2161 RepID=A0A2A2H743_METBR|nr:MULTISPECIES: hypothetical protein [Methanobacterium]OEC84973.1 hypothetical protein A9507_01185 [Methanobacterium sp. A39]PAV05124.1 hypothetical protein ASJ80_12610 [Methanobacterium bryantii]